MNDQATLNILAVGAHPDDVEFGCAGALARCIARGDRATIAIVCRGDSASSDRPPQELAAVRGEEARSAARLLGADLIQMGLPDYGVWYDRETLGRFSDVIRLARPDLVITHFHSDYGGDHNNTLKLVVDATLAAAVPNFPGAHPPLARIPWLYMMEPMGGYGFQPQVYVDVTATLATKLRMLECHQSQMQWMSRYGGLDSRRYVETVARFRGYQAGVEFAEGFIPHASFGHVPPRSVLP